MKIYIKSSENLSTLTLAKGIYIPNYGMPPELEDRYTDYYDSNIHGYLFFTEAQYDPITRHLSGELLNHKEIELKYNLTEAEAVSYFSVELNSDKSGTELIMSGFRTLELSEYLSKLFDVHVIASPNGEWVPIDSSEFKSTYRDAANKCKQLLKTTYSNNGPRSDYFAICFAVIDRHERVGIIGDSGILFAAYTYEDYMDAVEEFAKSLNKSTDDLSFKALFSDEAHLEGKSGPGTDLRRYEQVSQWANYISSLYTGVRAKKGNYKYHSAGITIKGNGNPITFWLVIEPDILEPKISSANSIDIPEDFEMTKDNADMIMSLIYEELGL